MASSVTSRRASPAPHNPARDKGHQEETGQNRDDHPAGIGPAGHDSDHHHGTGQNQETERNTDLPLTLGDDSSSRIRGIPRANPTHPRIVPLRSGI